MTKTLLIIGAGREQIEAYKIAKKIGLKVIGTDIDPDAPGFEFADHSLICSTRNAESSLHEVKNFSKKIKIDGVMTIANDAAPTVSLISQELKLPGISVQSSKFATNKILMKKQFSKYSIPTPKYTIIKEKDEFLKLLKKYTFPLILKPSDGRGSRGVLFIEKYTDFDWAWEQSLKNSENKTLILEEFVSGDQLSVEGLFINKKFIPVAFADRNYDVLKLTKPFIVENGGVIPSKFEGSILESIRILVEKAAKSIGIDWGPIKADVVLKNNAPQIIELAARLSGNYLASHHVPWSLGIDFVGASIKQTIGLEIKQSDLMPKFKKYLAARYFFPSSGIIKKIIGLEKVSSLSYVKNIEIFRKVGDFQPIITCHPERAGIIRVMGDSISDVTQKIENCVNMITFEIE
jgi:biotin carboxylase